MHEESNEHESDLEKIARLDKVTDERTGTTQQQLEQYNLLNAYNESPDISAGDALDKILGNVKGGIDKLTL
jgi:hypothetical protein